MAGPNIVSLENVVKVYAEKRPLDGINVGLDAYDRAGVIGINGSGKSTLLKVIAGIEQPDEGRVVHRKGLRVQYLDQEPAFDPDALPLEVIGGSLRAEGLLDRLGIAPDDGRRMGELSGGQRRRVALAGVLAADPDLLILDEPTNHLDPDVIEWLEGELTRRSGALLFVTHDRYVLSNVANRIIEVVDGRVHTNHGSYDEYLEARATRVEQAHAQARRRANLARIELDWLRRGPKARTSKAKHRVDKATALVEASKERIDESKLAIEFPSRRIGSTVVNAHNAGKSFNGQTVLSGVDMKVDPRARWGIVGPNGAGKSTLLKLLTGRLEPDTGSVRMGETVHVGWYGQEVQPIKPGTRVIDAVKAVAEETNLIDGMRVGAGDLLERFLFTKAAQRAFVEELSGGERRRLELLLVLADAPNFLILDEPTNDLDLDTLAVLTDYLDAWPGALLVASHDRYFLDRVCSDLYAIEPGGFLQHQPGGWTAWREAQGEAERARKRMAKDANNLALAQVKAKESPKPKTKLGFNEQREYQELGPRMDALSAQITELETRLATQAVSASHTDLAAWGEQLTQLRGELDDAEMRWLELAELAGE
ncbi:ABC-F family ATP-binding cassette domain-containing protein [Stomatohabitans albus]|uniref:ABC-F family ATP-binding cassette domain-containing protein n=1 Tax=Stomatohabitans albus TaxID=3110766 RepID=UPI00300D5229